MCALDLIMHLPRSVWSEHELDLVSWLLKFLGVDKVPSVDVLKRSQSLLQKLCGIKTRRYEGALGHLYFCNDLGEIIAQVCVLPLL